jgi:hypothetical protein
MGQSEKDDMHFLSNRSQSHLTLPIRPHVWPVLLKATPNRPLSPLESRISIQIRTGIGTPSDVGSEGRTGGQGRRVLLSYSHSARAPLPVRSRALIHPDND